MAEIEVKGTFNAQAFFTALAAILSKRERVKITVTVTEKERPAEPVRAEDRRRQGERKSGRIGPVDFFGPGNLKLTETAGKWRFTDRPGRRRKLTT